MCVYQTCIIAVTTESKPTICIIGGGPFVSRGTRYSRHKWSGGTSFSVTDGPGGTIYPGDGRSGGTANEGDR